MRREDVLDIVQRVPEKDHPKLQFILRSGVTLNVELFIKFEPNYVCFRGRESGNVDEGRGFFVPYDEMTTIKLERVVKLVEMKQMFGESGEGFEEDKLAPSDIIKTPNPILTPAPTGPMDPAQIAKQNLLARIRAARTAAGVGQN